MLTIVCGSSVFVFVLLCITLCPFYFCNHLEEEEKAGCFAIITLVNVNAPVVATTSWWLHFSAPVVA